MKLMRNLAYDNLFVYLFVPDAPMEVQQVVDDVNDDSPVTSK